MGSIPTALTLGPTSGRKIDVTARKTAQFWHPLCYHFRMPKNSMDDWTHGMPVEIREALSREIDTKDNAAYGELSLEAGDPFVLVSGEWTKFVGWNEPSLSNLMDVEGDTIIVPNQGVYLVSGSLSFETSNTSRYEVGMFVNDVLQHNIHIGVDMTPNTLRSTGISGLVQLYPGDVIDIRIKTGATPTITPSHGTITVLGIHVP